MSDDVATDERVLELERLIAAPPERVRGNVVAFRSPPFHQQLGLDVRPGGHWRTTMRSPEGKRVTVSGVYRVIDKPRRLVFTWAWDQDDGSRGHETEVTVTFAPAPGGTRLKLLQQAFQDQAARDRHRHGWTSSFVCLAQAAE